MTLMSLELAIIRSPVITLDTALLTSVCKYDVMGASDLFCSLDETQEPHKWHREIARRMLDCAFALF